MAHASDHAALVAALEAGAGRLAERSLDVTFRNPFWAERYAERGRRLSVEDSHFHVTYLREALTAGAPDTLVAYARWLRRVLVARGMCSLHLADHLVCLGRTAVDEGLPNGAIAAAYLDAAAAGLRPEREPAGALHDAAIASTRPGDEVDPVSPRYLIAYLADAVALDRPKPLADYIAWCEGHLAAHGRPASTLEDSLEAAARAAGGVGAEMVRRARVTAGEGGARV